MPAPTPSARSDDPSPVRAVLCPHCRTDLNDPSPECPACGFHIRDLDAELGDPPPRPHALLDAAGLLSERGADRTRRRIERFAERTGAECLVVTRRSTAPRTPAEYVFWLFNRWGVGGEEHRGLLVFVAAEERRVEVEVGHGLEDIVTDDVAQSVLDEDVAPMLARGDADHAVHLAVDLLATVVENALGTPA